MLHQSGWETGDCDAWELFSSEYSLSHIPWVMRSDYPDLFAARLYLKRQGLYLSQTVIEIL